MGADNLRRHRGYQGRRNAATTLQPQLDELATIDAWSALVAVLRRILAGERGDQLLTGLDRIDTAIARETLRRLATEP